MNLTAFKGAVSLALESVHEHADTVGLSNTDEFTFRAFLMRAIKHIDPSVEFETEWNTFDLLVTGDGWFRLVELKYYLYRYRRLLQSARKSKGGAGPKNEREFRRCIDKVAASSREGVTHRSLVLVYEVDATRRGRSFGKSYSNLGLFVKPEYGCEITPINHSWQDRLACTAVEFPSGSA